MIVEGDEITIDLTGSNAEVPTGFNVPFEGTTVVGATFISPHDPPRRGHLSRLVPQNDGVLKPVKVIAPKGTIFNPTSRVRAFPGSARCSAWSTTRSSRSPTRLPQGVTAGNSAGIHFCAYSGFVEEMGEYWVYLEVDEGSYGGRHGKDATGLRRQPDREHAEQPDRGARMAVPDADGALRTPRRPVAAGEWRGGIGMVRVT